MTAAIVVAGGRSTRFGGDKLAVEVGGRTLLGRTVDAVLAAGCGPVVVVTARPLPVAEVVAVSEWPRWSGPCAGVAAGVEALVAGSRAAGNHGEACDHVLILPADLADPEAAVAALLDLPGAGVLRDACGRAQWLLARAPLADLVTRCGELRAAGPLAGLSARALLGGLPVADRNLLPLATADIDRPADLDLLKEPTRATV